EVKRGPAAVVTVRHVEPHDRRGQIPLARGEPRYGLRRDLADAVGRHDWTVIVSQRIALLQRVVTRVLVDASRGAMKEGARGATSRHEPAGTLGVCREIVVEVAVEALHDGEVEDVIEILRNHFQPVAGEVGANAGDSDGFEPPAIVRMAQA